MSPRASARAVTAACVLSAVCGCDKKGPAPQEISVRELATQLKSASPPEVFDANGAWTRREYGVIPGATLLPGSSDYALELLPEDRTHKLVFYCASSWCGAAESAATRALGAGYSAVSVLPEGIKGWRAAGHATTSVP